MIVACVQICWVIDIADTVHGMWTFPREVYVAYSFLATLNSALNPIILVLRNRNFRREYFKVLRCSYLSKKKELFNPYLLLTTKLNALQLGQVNKNFRKKILDCKISTYYPVFDIRQCKVYYLASPNKNTFFIHEYIRIIRPGDHYSLTNYSGSFVN